MADEQGTPVTASGQGGGESVLDSVEPQEERGAPGSRDEGGPPASGPADRPVGSFTSEDSTRVSQDRSTTADPEMPDQPAGDQGG